MASRPGLYTAYRRQCNGKAACTDCLHVRTTTVAEATGSDFKYEIRGNFTCKYLNVLLEVLVEVDHLHNPGNSEDIV